MMTHDSRLLHQHDANKPSAWRLRLAVLWVTLLGQASAAAGGSGTANCAIVAPIPRPPANATVFGPGGGGDDTTAIQAAIDGLSAGGWLVFAPGTYSIGRHLTAAVRGITLYGKGAVIHSSSATDGGLMIEADDVRIYGFTFEQDSVRREAAPWSGGVSVFDGRGGRRHRVVGAIIEDNTINNAAAAGIFLYKASSFTVAGNTVFRSWADGIHATGGSSDGRIIGNSVAQNGDDMVAVVSYAGQRNVPTLAARYRTSSADDLDRNIYVAGNKLADTYWGRGISVVGGSDVTIENNDISRTPTAAGIYLLRERSYVTYGDHNILVQGNTITHVQTAAPTYKPPNVTLVLTHHGALEISSQLSPEETADAHLKGLLSVSGIALVGNTVRDARFAGVRLGAVSESDRTVSEVLLQGNSLEGVGTDVVAEVHPGVDRATLSCKDNKLNGVSWSSSCDKSSAGTTSAPVTGASLQCLPDGTMSRTVTPKAPTDLH